MTSIIGAYRRCPLASSLFPFLNSAHLQPAAFRKLFAGKTLPFTDGTNVCVGHHAHNFHWKFNLALHELCDLFGRFNQHAAELSPVKNTSAAASNSTIPRKAPQQQPDFL